jgi:hypothetical protein
VDTILRHLPSPLVMLTVVILFGSLGPLIWKYLVVIRADDVRWSRDRCREKGIDYSKALRRRVSWKQLGVPLWLLAAPAYIGLIIWPSWRFYELVALAAFLSTPLRMTWGMAVVRAYQSQNGRKPQTSFWEDITSYYELGFTFPARTPTAPWFEDKWLVLNNLQRLWWFVQMWRSYGYFFLHAFACAAWFLTAPFMPFYHMDMIDDDNYTRPAWRFDRHEGRPVEVVDSKAVPNPAPAPDQPAGRRLMDGDTIDVTDLSAAELRRLIQWLRDHG